MILRVYADESYTDKALTLCGFIATSTYWRKFERRWESVLNDFGAPYFHFREFADKKCQNKIETNPFLTTSWNEKKRDLFINELAIVLSEEAVPVGGVFDNVKYLKQAMDFDSKNILISEFYIHFQQQLDAHWPEFDGQVLFIFDETDNEEWKTELNKIHNKVRAADRRIGTLTFEDDKKCPPLQGADLYAYIVRQLGETYYAQSKTRQPKRHLDWILSKNAYPGFKGLHTAAQWERLVRMVLADRRKKIAIWAVTAQSKRKYYPELDFREQAQKLGLPLVDAEKM